MPGGRTPYGGSPAAKPLGDGSRHNVRQLLLTGEDIIAFNCDSGHNSSL